MYRIVLLLGALVLAITAKAESLNQSFTNQGLDRNDPLSTTNFLYPENLYYLQNGKVLTRGNDTPVGVDVKPALAKGWQVVNSKQTMNFSIDPSASLTVVSLRARERSDGMYEAAAICSPGPFSGRVCRAFVSRVKISGKTSSSVLVSKVLPLAPDFAIKKMTLQIEDVYEDAGSKVSRVLLIVDDKVSDTLDATSYSQADANPLYGQLGGLGFLIQGYQSRSGRLTAGAVYSYTAEYVPHNYGRMCYTSAGALQRCGPNATLKAFTVALPSEQIPGMNLIYSVANPNLPANIRFYQTQSYGEAIYLISLGYIAYGGFGNTLPTANCAGTAKEILHRYNTKTGQHVFAANSSTLVALVSGPQWAPPHTSLGCSLE